MEELSRRFLWFIWTVLLRIVRAAGPEASATTLVAKGNAGEHGLNHVCNFGVETWYFYSPAPWSLTNCAGMLSDFRRNLKPGKIGAAEKSDLRITGDYVF